MPKLPVGLYILRIYSSATLNTELCRPEIISLGELIHPRARFASPAISFYKQHHYGVYAVRPKGEGQYCSF